MLVLVAWGVWKTALWFGLRRRHIAIDALANTLALDSLLVFRGTSPMPNRAFNTTIHIFEWIGSVDCAWGPELRADPPMSRPTNQMNDAEDGCRWAGLRLQGRLGISHPRESNSRVYNNNYKRRGCTWFKPLGPEIGRGVICLRTEYHYSKSIILIALFWWQ